MRIIRLEAFAFHRVLDGTAWNPVSRWHERRAPLLRITADDGIAGLGEGWCEQARIGDFFIRVAVAADRLLGRDPDEITGSAAPIGAEDRVGAAVASAIDIALWDMRARRSRLPLHRVLGAMHDTVPVYASGGLYADGKDDAALAAEMRGYIGRGFTEVKMKIGALGIDADLHRVWVVRDAIGPEAGIIVDAVGQLTRETAPDWFARLHAVGVRAVQMPVAADDMAGMAALQRLGFAAVVADETAFRPASFRKLLDAAALGWLQFNPGLAGGMSGGLALIAMAEAASVPATLQCHATAVLQAACLHLAAARSSVRSAEFHMFHDHLHHLLPAAMRRVQGGRITLGAELGLGIDPGFLDAPLAGPGRLARIVSLSD